MKMIFTIFTLTIILPLWSSTTTRSSFAECFKTQHRINFRGTSPRSSLPIVVSAVIADDDGNTNNKHIIEGSSSRKTGENISANDSGDDESICLTINRRKFVPQAAVAIINMVLLTNAMVGMSSNAIAVTNNTIMETDNDDSNIIVVPLEYISTLNAYVVRYTLFGERFAAIVDTGSPFLTVPSYCGTYRDRKINWGCFRPELTKDSGYANTVEGFDNSCGTVVWRKAGFSFSNNTSLTEEVAEEEVVFGVLSEELMNGPGGVFFGLIKETATQIRPSFLSQIGYNSFSVDLRHGESNNSPRLILSKQPMIDANTYNNHIPLTKDLYRKYKAPVVHYTAKASQFIVNGKPLLVDKNHPLYVIFDTGVSGMVVSQELYDGRYLQARKNREKSLWGTVEISFETIASGTGNSNNNEVVTLKATKPITTPLGKATPWRNFRGNLIAIGLAFLEGYAMTIDIEDGKIVFTQ